MHNCVIPKPYNLFFSPSVENCRAESKKQTKIHNLMKIIPVKSLSCTFKCGVSRYATPGLILMTLFVIEYLITEVKPGSKQLFQ